MADTRRGPERKVFTLLYETRMARGLTTLKRFADATRLSWTHLAKIENGKEPLTWPTCHLLANVLGLNPDTLWEARPRNVVRYESAVRQVEQRKAAA